MTAYLFDSTTKPFPAWFETADHILKTKLLPLGLFVQLTGKLWLGSNGGYISQTYIWCLLPGLISLCLDIYRYGIRSCIAGMTMGEKLLALLFLWIQINPLFADGGMDMGTVFNRIIKISLYLYVVRTVVLHHQRPERLLLLSAFLATLFAMATMVYQFGILDHPMGIRALGVGGYRVGSLGVGEFADLSNPILAALYYGSFAAILSGYIAAKPFQWQRRAPAILAVLLLGLFILLSGSRAPLMAFLAMGTVALLICQYPWKKPVIGAFIIASLGFAIVFHQDIQQQLQVVLADGFNGRFAIWNAAVDGIKQKPFFGYGAYAEFAANWQGFVIRHQHSMLLNISYNWGMPAGLLFLAIAAWGLQVSWVHRKHPLLAIAGCVLVFGQVGMITDTYSFLVRPNLQWLLFFFPVALCAASKRAEFTEQTTPAT